MKKFCSNFFLVLASLMLILQTSCSESTPEGKINSEPNNDLNLQSPGTQPASNPSTSLTAQNIALSQTLVSGCLGSGELKRAEGALVAGRFSECFEQAACAFNESIQSESLNPQAAWITLLCHAAQTTESASFKALFKLDKATTAQDFFGESGDIYLLRDQWNQITAYGSKQGIDRVHHFVQQHGTVKQAFVAIRNFVEAQGPNAYILYKALATAGDGQEFELPAGYVQTDDPISFRSHEAALMRYNVALAYNLVQWFDDFYELGFQLEDLLSKLELTQALNSDPEFLILKNKEQDNGTSMIPVIEELLAAVESAAEVQLAGEILPLWTKLDYFFPNKSKTLIGLRDAMIPLRQSLKDQFVEVQVSESTRVKINLGKLLAKLSSADEIDSSAFSYDQNKNKIKINLPFVVEFLGEALRF